MSQWKAVLCAVCRIAKAGQPITAKALAKEADIGSSERCKAPAIASAWLSKFARWGYVRRSGLDGGAIGRGRRMTVYTVTDWGKKCGPEEQAKDEKPARRKRPPA